MIENFETYLASEGLFTAEEIKQISFLATAKKFRRRQLLLHEGEVCRNKTFVVKGLLRSYFKKDDGSEYIMRFATENTWTIDPESYYNIMPSKYNIEALEDTEALVWAKGQLEELIEKIPAFKAFSEKLRSASHDASQNRVLMNISATAEEKYQDFITSFPDVFARVPLHMVASYLGVSRETLSRIRHAQLKRT